MTRPPLTRHYQPEVIAATRRIVTAEWSPTVKAHSHSRSSASNPKRTTVSLIAQHVADGRWLTANDQDSILIGRGLADVMDVKVGDRITLVGSDIHKQNRQRTMTSSAL